MTTSTPVAGPLAPPLRRTLLEVARRAIETSLAGESEAHVDADDYPVPLRARRACFVSLKRAGQLRGCIGSLEPSDSLVEDVWRNARRAAFHDPRFEPLTSDELPGLEVHIEVLGPLEAMPDCTNDELLRSLRVGKDGLLIECPGHRATFLPAVWEGLPEPTDFVYELKRKAGLPGDHPAETLKIARYTTEAFDESD